MPDPNHPPAETHRATEARAAPSAPATAGAWPDRRRRHPVLAMILLGLVFLTAAVLQTLHTQRTGHIDHAVTAARTEHACLLRYAAGYEHQIRTLVLPGSDDRAAAAACRRALTTLEASPHARPNQFADLRHALTRLDAARKAAAVPKGDHVNAVDPATFATASRLGVALNDLMRIRRPPLERQIAALEARRTREETAWNLVNLTLLTLLALGSTAFVWRLTRRLSAEHALVRGVIDASPVAIFWKDREGRLLGYNEIFARVHGLSRPGEGVGKTVRDLGLRDEDARIIHAQEQYVIETGRPLLNVQEQVGSPDEPKWLSISRVPLRDVRGRVTGVLGNFTEESDRVHAEQLALEMSGRLAMGLNAAHGGEWEWNVKTGAAQLSDRWLKLFGLDRTPAADHFAFFRDRVHPDDLPAIEAALNDHFAGHCSAYRAEYRIRTGAGDYRWTLGCGRVVERDAESQPVRLQGLNLDIHPARQAREELRHSAERADAANRAKSDFLATMSHELRTPLSGIIGMTELLGDTALNGRQQSLVASCRDSSQMLLDLINGLLDFSKIEAGRMELDDAPFSPARCVWSTAAVMAVHAHRAGLELDVEVDDGVSDACRGDPGRLRQVLVNLLANAVKFTEAGRVGIRLSETAMPARAAFADGPAAPTGRALRFVVTDTGIGIRADQQAALFEPFVQTDATITRRYGGTGLGLSISRSLVEAMGGHITLDSAEGRGSTFTVTIPVTPVDPATSTELSSAMNERPEPLTLRGRVCLSDSDAAGRPQLIRRLRSLGLELVDPGETCDLRITNVRADTPEPAAFDGGDPTPHLRLTPVTCPTPPAGAGPTRALAKPCCDRQLAGAIGELLSGETAAAKPAGSHRSDAPPLPDPADTEMPEADVLVVEDDLTNRQYLAELLRRDGLTCQASTNGRDATDRCVRRMNSGRRAFRLVLMDYHLPETDGWTATRAIRAAEAAAGATPVVIIGVTAAGGVDNRDAGTAAGIDAWLSKPIDPARLRSVIARYTASETPEFTNTPSTSAFPPPPLDADAALARCLGDAAFLSATLASFARTLPRQIEAFEAALTAGNPADAGAVAHGIKGAAGLVTAFRLRDLAAGCEQLGVDGGDTCLDDLRNQVDALRAETQRCIDHATRIRADLPA